MGSHRPLRKDGRAGAGPCVGVVAAGSTALTVTDVTKEDAEVQTLFNRVMTDEVKEAFRLHSVGIRSTR